MDARYVREALGDTLTRGCALVAQFKPDDPIEWLADFLRHDAKQQELTKLRHAEADRRAKLLEEALRHEEADRQRRAEEERLAAERRPNAFMNACQEYLADVKSREHGLRASTSSIQEFGRAALVHCIADIADVIISEEARNLEGSVPMDVVSVLRAGLLLVGYPSPMVEGWEKVKALIDRETFCRRFETFDAINHTSINRVAAAVREMDGIDIQSRVIQKHAYGPLAVRFHTCTMAAVQAFGLSLDGVYPKETVQDGTDNVTHNVWRQPADPNEFYGQEVDEEELNKSKLCGLELLNAVVLDDELTKNKMRLRVFWKCTEGSSCDPDASLIMFDRHGVLHDNIYHLIHSSHDNSMHHMGDNTEASAHVPVGDDFDDEHFILNLAETDPNTYVIAVVLNVAVDGEDLSPVQQCSMSIHAGDSGRVPPSGLVDFNLSRVTRSEMLLGLIYRDINDPSQWHMMGLGEAIQGAEREKEASQNFMNAAPLAMRYIKEMNLIPPNQDPNFQAPNAFNPFKMIPGDNFEVPALALEAPVVIGMGWDVDEDIAMDLDCGLAVYSGSTRTDYCDFEKLTTNDGACQHQGDNRDGEGEGDDEQIIIEFGKLDPLSDALFLYAAVYEGGALKDVENVHIRMVTQRDGKLKEICRFSLDWLANVEEDTAVILARISRTENGGFAFNTIGVTAHGRTIEELEGRLQQHLQ